VRSSATAADVSLLTHWTRLLVVVACLVCAAPGWAQETTITSEEAPTETKKEAPEAPKAPKALSPLRGTTLSVINTVTALSVDPSAELTYNPYYAVTLSLQPWWWFNDIFYVNARLDISREITEADTTTQSGETILGDTKVSVGASKFWVIPVVGIDLSSRLSIIAPSSPHSQAQSLLTGINGTFTLGRTFDAAGPLRVQYTVGGTGRLHRYTTSQYESSVIPGCVGGSVACDSFFSTGRRNAHSRLSNSIALSWQPLKWLGISTSFGLYLDWLYPVQSDDAVSNVPLDPTNRRVLMSTHIEVATKPISSLTVALGASTVNPALQPDSTYYTPFFNRYTTVYLDLRLSIADLVSVLTPAEETP